MEENYLFFGGAYRGVWVIPQEAGTIRFVYLDADGSHKYPINSNRYWAITNGELFNANLRNVHVTNDYFKMKLAFQFSEPEKEVSDLQVIVTINDTYTDSFIIENVMTESLKRTICAKAKAPMVIKCEENVLEAEDYEFASLPGEEINVLQYNAYFPGGEIKPDETYDNLVLPIKVRKWSGIATTHTEIAQWKNTRDLEMVFEVSWVHRVVPIESVQLLEDGRLYIKPVEPAFHSARTVEGVQIEACPNYIENVFELLGEPLEWYFDRTEQMLYVGFEEGDTPDNHEIILPLVEQLLEVKGELDNQPCHLSFRNLQFAHTTWLFPQQYGVPEVQANQMKFSEIPEALILEKPYEADYQKVISALRILAAKDISFEKCSFTALGTGALQYEYGTQDCRIIGNHFYEIGGSAVCMGDFYLERAHHPEDRREIVRAIEVTNNYIHDTGRDYRGSAAILAGYVQDVTIAHNDIHDVPYSAISLGWGWADVSVGPKLVTQWEEPSVCLRNRILYNHIHHCMMQLHDGGAIYTIGSMAGTAIIGNYIHESSGYQGDGYDGVLIYGYQTDEVRDPAGDYYWNRHGVPGGIYLDEGSVGIDVCGNVLHDVAVPLFYHNQIDLGYTRVWYRDNILNKKPGDEGFPAELVECAGCEPAYRNTAMRK